MKILLLGANGQLGRTFLDQGGLAARGELAAACRDGVLTTGGLGKIADLSDPASLPAVLDRLRPDVIVNAAAYTAVDRAEQEEALATRVNGEAVGVLGSWAAAHGALVIHYSTDYVFDGSGDAPRSEDAPTGPLSVYGRTKLDGEDAIRASGCRHVILRTSWVYAARGANFAQTMLRLAQERERLAVIDDQVGAPTGAELLADVSAHVLRAALARPEFSGTYHCVAAGETSWHGYARHVIEFARAAGAPIRVAPDAIAPILTSAYPTPAVRPKNSRLDTTKLRTTFGLALPPWQAGVDRVLTELLKPAP